MVQHCKNADYEFRPLKILDFHVNAGIAGLGAFYTLLLVIHALYKYTSTSTYCCNNNYKHASAARQKKMNTRSFCTLLCVLICSLLLFSVYTLEFWFFRLCNFFNWNINPFTFCNYFQHCLYSSVIIYTWTIYIYFSVRLTTSFKSSSLAFPTDCFVLIRIFATIAVIAAIAVAFIFTCGIPWNIELQQITSENPWLCRNIVLWEWYWEYTYFAGAFMLLSANFMNWIGYMNRLTKLIGMKLRYTLSFKNIVHDEMNKDNKNSNRDATATSGMSFNDTEDMDDDIIYEHKYCESIEMETPTPTPIHEIQYNNQDTVFSESVNNKQNINENKKPLKNDIKARMMARRKPSELRFYNLIRKQSILTGVVSISSFTFWGLQTMFDKGSIFILSDILINVTCVYLSISWTKSCYNRLCLRLSYCCCWCCEDCIESKVARELKIEAKKKETSPHFTI